MTATLSAAPDTARLTTGSALQALLPELVALTLDAKQAHWNVTGPAFLPLHAVTDDIAEDVRGWSDRIAERAVALGTSVDARPATVAAVVDNPMPAGWLADDEVITELAARIDQIIGKAGYALAIVDDSDPVAHGMIVDVLEGLEKYRWMLGAHAHDRYKS